MQDGDTIIHNKITYTYDEFYDRLEAFDIDTKYAILCPKCMSSMFSISYDIYACIANCVCGHSFTIYDG